MDLIGLRGRLVRLVPPDRALHLENALRWLNDPEATAFLKHNWGVTRLQEEEFFERLCTQRETDLVWAVLDEEDRHVGFTGLHRINWRIRCADGGLFLGERAAWGRGLGTDTLRTRARFAFEQMGLHRIEGRTFNPAMRRVYEKAGYRHEGTARRKYWRDGRWHDVELFAILDEDYAALPAAAPATGA